VVLGAISENIREVLEQVKLAALKANRNPFDINIVVVTKTVPVDSIEEAVSAGLKILGENRVQELTAKYPFINKAEWHLIGHLQSNKVKYIVDKVSMIHSLDSISLAEEINKRMLSLGRTMDVLVQVNIAEELTKSGICPEDTVSFIDSVRKLPGLKIKGLMTIGPYVTEPEDIRPVFRTLKQLSEKVKTMEFPEIDMIHLSMGMSNDYRVAIEEGATLIRLGSILFGFRK
jgi:pyridoxal phosphate enzyme (YggS family)